MTSAAKLPASVGLIRHIDFPHKLGVCERLFGARLAKFGIAWVDTAAGIRWKLDLGNATHRWIVYGKYEGAPFLNWAKRFLPRNGVVVDSGANIGQMLLYLAQWVPRGRVLAIEPGEHQANWLSECLAVNPNLPVELLRVALGQSPGRAFLSDPGMVNRHGSWSQISESDGEPVEIVRLSDLLKERGIEVVDLWKLDVEGFEIPALEGAGDWLTNQRIRALYVELRGENGRSIRNYLETRGYKCKIFGSKKSRSAGANGLFLARG